jgi:hypothetical protein
MDWIELMKWWSFVNMVMGLGFLQKQSKYQHSKEDCVMEFKISI